MSKYATERGESRNHLGHYGDRRKGVVAAFHHIVRNNVADAVGDIAQLTVCRDIAGFLHESPAIGECSCVPIVITIKRGMTVHEVLAQLDALDGGN